MAASLSADETRPLQRDRNLRFATEKSGSSLKLIESNMMGDVQKWGI